MASGLQAVGPGESLSGGGRIEAVVSEGSCQIGKGVVEPEVPIVEIPAKDG